MLPPSGRVLLQRRLDGIQRSAKAAAQDLLCRPESRPWRRGPHPVSPLVKEGDQLVAISFDACRQRPGEPLRPAYVFASRLGRNVVARILHTPPPQGPNRPDHMTLVTSNLRLASLPSGKDHP